MKHTKTLAIKRETVSAITQFILLVSIATFAPLIRQQAIVGPIVNATLFVSTAVLGLEYAVLVGLVPSLIALSVGLLPIVLAPMIPFIVVGNTILILIFSYLNKKNYWQAVIFASFLKFIFLFSTSSIVINLLFKKEIAQSVAMMMSWPQFLTALSGGLIAYLSLKTIKKV